MNIFKTTDVAIVDGMTDQVVRTAQDYEAFKKDDPRLPNCRSDKSNSVVNTAPVFRGHHY